MDEKDKKILKMFKAMRLDMNFKDVAMKTIKGLNNDYFESGLSTEKRNDLFLVLLM